MNNAVFTMFNSELRRRKNLLLKCKKLQSVKWVRWWSAPQN